jgi:two-component system nitrogen regulation sensor histidine kinase NtrY
LLGLSISCFTYAITKQNLIVVAVVAGAIILAQIQEMYRFVSVTNQKLTRFLESVRYSDFLSGFSADNQLGKSFRELNLAFNEVLEAFRRARAEKEEHWQYLNTVVQQVRTGILSYDEQGTIQLINTNAKRILQVSTLKSIHDLRSTVPALYHTILAVQVGKSDVYKLSNEVQLIIQVTELRIRMTSIKLVTLQNIQPELQRQELEAWQNLTKVLRHEIMNSITPITSLTSTLREILEEDLKQKDNHFELNAESASDIKLGLSTIENRSKGLINFIDAYREYTTLPKPNKTKISLHQLIEHVGQLMRPEIKKTSINFNIVHAHAEATLLIDVEMIEQVLINLLKNAIEALQETPNPTLTLVGSLEKTSVRIQVIDNGSGIIQEAIEKIFVPFYTTKRTGSGIGLSLSRQIMQMHQGSITVTSEPDVETIFTLYF